MNTMGCKSTVVATTTSTRVLGADTQQYTVLIPCQPDLEGIR